MSETAKLRWILVNFATGKMHGGAQGKQREGTGARKGDKDKRNWYAWITLGSADNGGEEDYFAW